MNVKKYDILLINLNPTKGSEKQGIRPCLVVQNNAANEHANTTVVCPISSVIKKYPHTLIVESGKINGLQQQSRVDILQIRVIDQSRVIKKIGVLDEEYKEEFRNRMAISFDLDDIL